MAKIASWQREVAERKHLLYEGWSGLCHNCRAFPGWQDARAREHLEQTHTGHVDARHLIRQGEPEGGSQAARQVSLDLFR